MAVHIEEVSVMAAREHLVIDFIVDWLLRVNVYDTGACARNAISLHAWIRTDEEEPTCHNYV